MRIIKMFVFILFLFSKFCVSEAASENFYMKSQQKLLLFNNSFVDAAIAYYTRLRDYFRPHKGINGDIFMWTMVCYPKVVVVNILAEAVNATIVPPEHEQNAEYSEIRFYYSSFWNQRENDVLNDTNLTHEFPVGYQMAQVDAVGWGFIYTDITKKEKISVFDFSLFTAPLDWWAWLFLLCAFVLIVPLTGKISRVIMPLASATLSPGTRGPPTKSKIFFLWVASCMVLGNIYSGELTSKMMVPLKDIVMTKFIELEQNNYTAIIPVNVEQWLPGINLDGADLTRSFPGNVAQRLTKNAEQINDTKIHEALVMNNRRHVAVGPWPGTHTIAWIYGLLKARHPEIENFARRVSHIGGELEQIGEQFFLFLPPDNLELFKAFRRLFESGIYQRWDQEELALMHSSRVQDRVRVKSPTKMEPEIDPFEPQKLKGKVITMFLLWEVCIVISLIGFFCEVTFRNILVGGSGSGIRQVVLIRPKKIEKPSKFF